MKCGQWIIVKVWGPRPWSVTMRHCTQPASTCTEHATPIAVAA